jgi:dolichol-phosphate mannosyltransferase
MPVVRALVILPTYREAENIEGILAAIRTAEPSVDILVIDDSSPDGTADLVRNAASKLGQITLVERPSKSGLGSAYRHGFRLGIEQGYDALIEMDADFSHDPKSLSTLLDALTDDVSLVIGSRYVPGGSIPDWSWRRRALSRWGNRYASLVLGFKVSDATSGYRAYHANAVGRLDLDSIRTDGYGFQIEMAYRVFRTGRSIVEVPISFTDRVAGESKMSSRIVVEALLWVTAWGVKYRILRRK